MKRIADVIDILRNEEHTYWLAIAGGNYLYVSAYLRDIRELDQYAAFIKKEARVITPTVGIFSLSTGATPLRDPGLTTIDYRIIYSLRNDSRKAFSDVAEEVGISPKSVKHRLSKMHREGKVEFSMQWYPDVSDDIATMLHIVPKTDSTKGNITKLLFTKYSPNVLFCFDFCNLPNLMLSAIWTTSMKELKDIIQKIGSEKGVDAVISNVLYTGFIFDTWRDKLVEDKGAPYR
jgi:DNA-binding Lrp family transcriptional regulator